jgi:hypothetical protein
VQKQLQVEKRKVEAELTRLQHPRQQVAVVTRRGKQGSPCNLIEKLKSKNLQLKQVPFPGSNT